MPLSSEGLTLDLEPFTRLTYHDAKHRLVEEFHRAVLPRVVKEAGSVPRAAEILGIPRTSLYRMLKQARGEYDD